MTFLFKVEVVAELTTSVGYLGIILYYKSPFDCCSSANNLNLKLK